ncbi:UDP-3-O-(3-hydroxymyristoyl)glucosamine N-acyltransferase [Candidatus Neomarinimicrobiota bacterium]
MPTLDEIAHVIHGVVEGDGAIEITHACEITAGSPGGITFLSDSKYEPFLAESPASAIILQEGIAAHGKAAIRVDHPGRAFAELLAYLYSETPPEPGIHPTALVEANVHLGQGIVIGPNVVIGSGVKIGDGSIIHAGVSIGMGISIGRAVTLYENVVIYDKTQVGNEVIIHSGAVIGADGFGYVTQQDQHYKIPQVGRVVIGDRVEIGANSTIDRGSLGDTVIGADTKIDNLVHIAHNVKVGRGCLFAAMVGIAGSTTIGDFVTLAGQVGVADHLTVGDRVVVAAKSAIMQSVPAGQSYAGIPAVEHSSWLRQYGAVKKLPELLRRVRDLETRLLKMKTEIQSGGD